MKVTDKRKFTTEGDPTGNVAEVITDEDVKLFLSDAPRVYGEARPRGDRVLIKQHAAETTFSGTRYVIPEVAQKAPNVGIVIAIGPKVDAELDCKPGDLVIFNVYSAESVTLGEENFVHVSKEDIHLCQAVTFAVQSQTH